MTDEEAFQTALDRQPDDHHLRLVFADWLEEQADPRAAGYRALGRLSKQPDHTKRKKGGRWWYWMSGDRDTHLLPQEWWGHFYRMTHNRHRWVDFRRDVENAAALAFSKLSPERQQELLRRPVLA